MMSCSHSYAKERGKTGSTIYISLVILIHPSNIYTCIHTNMH